MELCTRCKAEPISCHHTKKQMCDPCGSDANPRAFVLLRIDPQPKPIYIVIDVEHYERQDPIGSDEDNESSQYYYDEHSCPAPNIIPVEAIIYDGDADRHGLIEYVRKVENTHVDKHADPDWLTMFPETVSET